MSVASTDKVVRARGMRGHILDTALRLFTRYGYFNTSIHDIQRDAGISIGSIYNHFGGKEGVAKALYHELLERMAALVDEVTALNDTAYGRGRAAVMYLFELTEQDPVSMRFILDAKHREFLPDEPPICSAKPFVKLRDIVSQGVAAGEIRDMDPWVASAVTFGPALRMIGLRLDGVLPCSLDEYADSVWESAWLAVKADKG
ncbi:MAG: TetR/AcrR family transcriptional regulator [Chromatiaceae bacterium]|jgi:TetR/AcrR family transcriptional regulator, repressor of fatR-cypB operon